MRRVSIVVPGPVALVVACVLSQAALAQNKPAVQDKSQDGYHRMEIYNGPVRTVVYFGNGMSAGEQSTLRDMARAENELAMSDLVQQLRMQYLLGERNLEARRQVMNPLLYGMSATNRSAEYQTFGEGGSPYGGGYGGGYAPGFGTGTFYDVGYMASLASSTTYSLGAGVGSEGVVKNDLMKSLLAEATPEYRARLSRNMDRATAAVAESNTLRDKMNIKEAAATTDTASDSVTLKDGTTISGTIVKEDNDWVTIKTTAGKNSREEKVRASEVVRISRPDKGVRPASN
jgi:hypothetical protein